MATGSEGNINSVDNRQLVAAEADDSDHQLTVVGSYIAEETENYEFSGIPVGKSTPSSLPRIACSFTRDCQTDEYCKRQEDSRFHVPENGRPSVSCQTTWDWKRDLVLMQELLGKAKGVQTATDDDTSVNVAMERLHAADEFGGDEIVNNPVTDTLGYYDDSISPRPYTVLGFGPPLILQNPLESRIHATKGCGMNGQQQLATLYTSHYEILNTSMLDYIIMSDTKARDYIYRGLKVCPFCGTEVSPGKYCCAKYREFFHSAHGSGEDDKQGKRAIDREYTADVDLLAGATAASYGSGGKKGKGKVRIGHSRDKGTKSVHLESSKSKARSGSFEENRVSGDGKHRPTDHSAQRLKERLAAKARLGTVKSLNSTAVRASRIQEGVGGVRKGLTGGITGSLLQHLGTAKGGQLTTITYQLSSKKCLEQGWTISPMMQHKKDGIDTEASFSCLDDSLEPDLPLYQEPVRREPISRYYDNGCLFIVIFSDGSGSVFYPNGRLAVSVVTVGQGLFTYVIQDDSADAQIMAVFQPTGYGVVNFPTGQPRVCLNPYGGIELSMNGSRRRKWNWNELDIPSYCEDHDPFPSIYPIALGVNYNFGVRIISQRNISVTFTADCRSCRFHVGTQLRRLSSKKLQPLMDSSDQVTEFLVNSQSQIEGLLRKMVTALQFPKSPKPDCIPLPVHFHSCLQKTRNINIDHGDNFNEL